jgi:hypothetical protein
LEFFCSAGFKDLGFFGPWGSKLTTSLGLFKF